MGLLVLLVIGILVAYILYKVHPTRKPSDPVHEQSHSARGSAAPGGTTSKPGMGGDVRLVQTSDSGWLINTTGTFPLTIYGIDGDSAQELVRLLERDAAKGTYEQARRLTPFIITTNLRCKEIDEYVTRYKPLYLSAVERMMPPASELDRMNSSAREDRLADIRARAIDSLDVRPHADLELLFEFGPGDLALDDQLVDRYGVDVVRTYIGYIPSRSKIYVIPAKDPARPEFNRLVKAELAAKGPDIPVQEMLGMLRLKDMNAMVADIVEKPFGRKKQAIAFLEARPDLQKRISKHVKINNLYGLRPLPPDLRGIDLDKVSRLWEYAGEIAFLICHTYFMGSSNPQDMLRDRDYVSAISGWEVHPVNDGQTCPYCRRLAAKEYPTMQPPSVPFHIGCRCCLVPKPRR